MFSGQAPLLMLDLATSQIRDRQRTARGLVSRASVRRDRAARTVPAVLTRTR